jgi:hypothetical protein
VLHEQQFFELAGDLTVKIEFILTDEMADRLLESIRQENLSVIYARTPAQFDVIGERKAAEPPSP